jgi:hypothetical protein
MMIRHAGQDRYQCVDVEVEGVTAGVVMVVKFVVVEVLGTITKVLGTDVLR